MSQSTLASRIGDVSEAEANELDRLLAANPELRKEFVIAAATDAGLRELAIQRAAEPVLP